MISFEKTNDVGVSHHTTPILQVFKESLVQTKATEDFSSTQCLVANRRLNFNVVVIGYADNLLNYSYPHRCLDSVSSCILQVEY